MGSRTERGSEASALLLKKLCMKLTGLSDDSILPVLQHSLKIIGSNFGSPVETNEFQVTEKIKRKLVRKGREKDAAIFSDLHRKLQAQGLLKQRWAVLYLLMSLSDSANGPATKSSVNGSALFGSRLPSNATSTPFNPALHRYPPPPGSLGEVTALHSGVSHSTGSSGISSIRSDLNNSNPTVPHSYMPVTTFNSVELDRTGSSRTLGSRLASTLTRQEKSNTALVPSRDRRRNKPDSNILVLRGDKTSFELPEAELIKDLVYAFQGIEGKWIKFDPSKEGYRIDSQAGIPKAIRQLVSKLAECGWLYSKTKDYIQTRSADKTFGLVGQSFCAALHQELTEYYRLIAVLEGQLNQGDTGLTSPEESCITLRQLVVWTFDPLLRLKTLATVVDVCRGKKGGALASSLYSYMQHGDPNIKALIMHTLTMVSQPIYSTLIRWIYDGELEDTHDEFFVASDPTVKNDRLWHDKYTLRKSMVPYFITMDQARRILNTGKSINYLRQVCQDRTPTKGREVAMIMDNTKAGEMFMQDTISEFQHMIDTVYKETSRHLLDTLHNKYKFMDHLKAMRRYLLLGQGDFIRHLMDLLEQDLAKPAGNLYLHNLTGILETAVRATNAQFDDSDILKRLDVRLLEVSTGDTGWDVFSLDYHVDGPIRTVFTPECMIMYLRVFNFLWRSKRMEYILANIWRNQMASAKMLQCIPELSSILHQCHMLTSEMVHFVQQVQYYINFEVLECSWDELLTKVSEAEDLDYIIAAHQVFLDTIISRCLLDEQSKNILTQLRTIFDLIIDFQTALGVFFTEASEEQMARQHFDAKQEKRSKEGDWGLTEEEETEEQHRRMAFLKKIIPNSRAQFKVLSQSYQDMVQQFLVMLTTHQDVSLRFLSFRLDFNEHYKTKAPQLQSPLMYRGTRAVT
ncbi:gamma-tubulin complex component 3-like [Mizuhopecten yessoensis]|uniref:gamma-tubulin complex component 3-like n=1 Tax=Mizuhopecten yessoensis TaxID=6573 RepID=UPI000B459E9A|nr:gamma-tubulin complex component 3-like [Mizuhopecten yessoensis]